MGGCTPFHHQTSTNRRPSSRWSHHAARTFSRVRVSMITIAGTAERHGESRVALCVGPTKVMPRLASQTAAPSLFSTVRTKSIAYSLPGSPPTDHDLLAVADERPVGRHRHEGLREQLAVGCKVDEIDDLPPVATGLGIVVADEDGGDRLLAHGAVVGRRDKGDEGALPW
jgi:hypothetical protein